MRLHSVARHQVGNGQSLLVNTVQCHKQSCKRHILILKTLGFVILAKVVEFHVKGGDCFVAFIGNAMHYHANGRCEIKVAPHQNIALRRVYGQCRASVCLLRCTDFGLVMTLRQEFDGISGQLVGFGYAPLGHQSVKPVVALVLHVVQSVVQFHTRVCTFNQMAELQPHGNSQ